MGKIVFYEEQDFRGPSVECTTSECSDLLCRLSRCNSIRVESGAFMIYEGLDFTGIQYFLREGDYPDHHHWMSSGDSVRSCRLIPTDAGSFTMRMYERIEFGGQIMELADDDCPSVAERFHKSDIFSCNVTNGNWLFYEQPEYRGHVYLIRPGIYNRFSEWGSRSARVGSIKRIMDD